MEELKLAQKKSASSQSSVEVRLNRAVEEAERYKTALQKERTEAKVTFLGGRGDIYALRGLRWPVEFWRGAF